MDPKHKMRSNNQSKHKSKQNSPDARENIIFEEKRSRDNQWNEEEKESLVDQ